MSTEGKFLIILVLLNLAHWAADYTHLSTPWMLKAKRFGKPLMPILAHAGFHALLVLLISFCYVGIDIAMAACALQLLTHFVIDVTKGRLNYLIPALQNPANPFHWYVFGADQFLHQLVLISTTYLILQA